MVSSIPPKPTRRVRRIPPLPPKPKPKTGKSRRSIIVSKITASNKDLKQKQKDQRFLKKRVSKSDKQVTRLLTVVKKTLAKLLGKKRPLTEEEKRKLLKYKV